MKIKSLTLMLCWLAALAVLAQAQTPAQRPDPVGPLKDFYQDTKEKLIRAAEKMPAEYFSFKPTSKVRSFAEIFGHILDTNYHVCADFRGEANPNKEHFEQTLKSKSDVVKAVKASFDYCDGALKNLSEATLKETFKAGPQEMPKLAPLMVLITHGQEHYGSLVTYMRLKDVVPPTSEPPK